MSGSWSKLDNSKILKACYTAEALEDHEDKKFIVRKRECSSFLQHLQHPVFRFTEGMAGNREINVLCRPGGADLQLHGITTFEKPRGIW